MGTGPWEGGKGSRPRKYNVKQYLDNYERIFGNATKERLREEDDQQKHQDRDESRQAAEAGGSDSAEHS